MVQGVSAGRALYVSAASTLRGACVCAHGRARCVGRGALWRWTSRAGVLSTTLAACAVPWDGRHRVLAPLSTFKGVDAVGLGLGTTGCVHVCFRMVPVSLRMLADRPARALHACASCSHTPHFLQRAWDALPWASWGCASVVVVVPWILLPSPLRVDGICSSFCRSPALDISCVRECCERRERAVVRPCPLHRPRRCPPPHSTPPFARANAHPPQILIPFKADLSRHGPSVRLWSASCSAGCCVTDGECSASTPRSTPDLPSRPPFRRAAGPCARS